MKRYLDGISREVAPSSAGRKLDPLALLDLVTRETDCVGVTLLAARPTHTKDPSYEPEVQCHSASDVKISYQVSRRGFLVRCRDTKGSIYREGGIF